MAAAKRNKYETQARLSVVMAGVAGLLLVVLIVLVFRNFRLEELEVLYSSKGYSFPAILGTVALAAITSVTGFFSGLASAGHKRNKLSHLSWTGFFLNAGIATLVLCVFIFFWLAKERVS